MGRNVVEVVDVVLVTGGLRVVVVTTGGKVVVVDATGIVNVNCCLVLAAVAFLAHTSKVCGPGLMLSMLMSQATPPVTLFTGEGTSSVLAGGAASMWI